VLLEVVAPWSLLIPLQLSKNNKRENIGPKITKEKIRLNLLVPAFFIYMGSDG
jgi:hypothetical protein